MKPIASFLKRLCVLTLLSGCSYTTQVTSGAEYLAAYDPPSAGFSGSPSTDRLVAEIAAVEPQLRLPARIGVARVINGGLSAVPAAEEAILADLWKRHDDFGELIPVSPLVAELVADSQDASEARFRPGPGAVVRKIRLGAARQHLDAVLIYEVGVSARAENTPLAIADLTIIGGAFLPTREVTAEGRSSALLVDVRNGYPYGTAAASADLSAYHSSWGSDAKAARMADRAVAEVVENLAAELDAMLSRLKGELDGLS